MSSNNFIFEITSDKVLFTITSKNGKIYRYKFPLSEFSKDDLSDVRKIMSGDKCGGCITMPIKGMCSSKMGWCQASRKIGVLQEMYPAGVKA